MICRNDALHYYRKIASVLERICALFSLYDSVDKLKQPNVPFPALLLCHSLKSCWRHSRNHRHCIYNRERSSPRAVFARMRVLVTPRSPLFRGAIVWNSAFWTSQWIIYYCDHLLAILWHFKKFHENLILRVSVHYDIHFNF